MLSPQYSQYSSWILLICAAIACIVILEEKLVTVVTLVVMAISVQECSPELFFDVNLYFIIINQVTFTCLSLTDSQVGVIVCSKVT